MSGDRGADLRHAGRGALTNLINVVGALSLPLLHALILWGYGPEIYGLYAVAYTVAEMASKFGTIGLDKGLLRFIPIARFSHDEAGVRAALSTASITALVASLAATGAVVFFAGHLSPLFGEGDYAQAIVWCAGAIPFIAIINVAVPATLAAKIVRYNILVRSVAQPLFTGLFVLLFAISPSMESLCVAIVIASCLTALVAYMGMRRTFPPDGRPARWRGDVVRFSLPMGFSEGMNLVTHRAPLMLLAFYVTPAQVGAYAACDMIVRSVAGIRTAFDPILSPVLAEALSAKDNDRVSYNLKLMTRWVLLIMLPLAIGIFFLGSEVLALLSSDFRSAGLALSLLCAGYIFNGSLGLTGWVLVMSGRSWVSLFNNVVSAVLNVLLCLWLIPLWGIVGAAVATAASVTAMELLFLAQVGYLFRLQPLSWQSARIVGVGVASALVLAFALIWLPDTGVLRLALGMGVLLLAYGLGWRLLAFEVQDRHIVGRGIPSSGGLG